MDYGQVKMKILENSVRDKKSGCLVFQGAVDAHGFGRVRTPDGIRPAHRAMFLALAQERGEEVPPGMLVYHVCGNRACVEEDHLYLAPLQEPRPGNVLPKHKLTPEQNELKKQKMRKRNGKG